MELKPGNVFKWNSDAVVLIVPYGIETCCDSVLVDLV